MGTRLGDAFFKLTNLFANYHTMLEQQETAPTHGYGYIQGRNPDVGELNLPIPQYIGKALPTGGVRNPPQTHPNIWPEDNHLPKNKNKQTLPQADLSPNRIIYAI